MIGNLKVKYLIPYAFFDINIMCCQSMVMLTDSLSKGNVSFKSNTDSTSHLELPNTENVSFSKGYAKLFLAILTFKCLKSVTTLLSCVPFLLITMTELE